MINKSFTVFKGHQTTKTFYINQTINSVIGPYDMSLKTLVLQAFDRSPVPVLLYTISPSNRGLGFVTFIISALQTDLATPVDYFIIEDPSGIARVLSYGSLTAVNIHKYIPFNDILSAESPEGLVIPDNFASVKSYSWRLFLQNSVDPHIEDVDVNDETAWPPLFNFLIAKLTVYSYIMNLIESGLVGGLSSGFAGANTGIKKVETGPSNVEYHDSSKNLIDLLKTNSKGESSLDSMKRELCDLANKLRVNLPEICGPLNEGPIIPIKAPRICKPSTDSYLLNNFGQ